MKILFVGNLGLEYQKTIQAQKIHAVLRVRRSSEHEQSGGKELWFRAA